MRGLKTKLRALNIFNTYDVLVRFSVRGRDDLAVSYNAASVRSCDFPRTRVWSPYRKTDKDAHYRDNGAMVFVGLMAESMPKGLAWAESKYGIKDWVRCPFDTSARIPASVREKAIKAVMGEKHSR